MAGAIFKAGAENVLTKVTRKRHGEAKKTQNNLNVYCRIVTDEITTVKTHLLSLMGESASALLHLSLCDWTPSLCQLLSAGLQHYSQRLCSICFIFTHKQFKGINVL